MAVKKNIEEAQGKESYPCGLQLLIYSGKVLKDESTLEENNIGEEGFLVVMLSKVLYHVLIVASQVFAWDIFLWSYLCLFWTSHFTYGHHISVKRSLYAKRKT